MSEPTSPHRRRRRVLPRLPWLAILLAAGAVILGAVAIAHLRAVGGEAPRFVVGRPSHRAHIHEDRQASELARCRAVTDAEDRTCNAVWEERRKRFLGGPAQRGE